MDAAPAPARYERHRPEATLLYELVAQHYPDFIETLEREGRSLPSHVQQEFDAYLKCGRLEYGFLRVALGATDPQEAVLEPATLQVGLKLPLHEGRQAAAVPLQGRQERRVVLIDQLIKKSGLGAMAFVAGWRLGQGLHGASLRTGGGPLPAANPAQCAGTSPAGRIQSES